MAELAIVLAAASPAHDFSLALEREDYNFSFLLKSSAALAAAYEALVIPFDIAPKGSLKKLSILKIISMQVWLKII